MLYHHFVYNYFQMLIQNCSEGIFHIKMAFDESLLEKRNFLWYNSDINVFFHVIVTYLCLKTYGQLE